RERLRLGLRCRRLLGRFECLVRLLEQVGRPWVIGEELECFGVRLHSLVIVLVGGGRLALCNELVKVGLPFLFFFLPASLSLGFRLRSFCGLHEGHGVALGLERGGVIGHELHCLAKRLRGVLVTLGGKGGLALLHQTLEIGGLLLSFFLL